MLTATEFAKVEKAGFGGISHGYYAASKARKLPVANYQALNRKALIKQGVEFYAQVERLVDDFLKSQDAFLAFNVMGEPGTEYFPSGEATDEDIVRMDVVEMGDGEHRTFNAQHPMTRGEGRELRGEFQSVFICVS
jgi:hypothetical protein